ncbi:MAG: prepilin-type N-terminal cleavage/methylation domain-containing protein [Verrucomicrobia bacterium]|nr:prepilin-type N-terminal cleavage/methylation domain-containing protein [Verrucomicrobiota bacterium]
MKAALHPLLPRCRVVEKPRDVVRASRLHAGDGGNPSSRRLPPAAGSRSEAGFTMVEIAISIAIVAFALVAIIGVLPTGFDVQRRNRENTIINQEGSLWLEAIRSGAWG